MGVLLRLTQEAAVNAGEYRGRLRLESVAADVQKTERLLAAIEQALD